MSEVHVSGAYITRAELELIEAVRAGGNSPEFRLTIRHQHDGWRVESSTCPHSDAHKWRGAGATFEAAWRARTKLAIDPISPVPSPRR
jgi:hypothetical protein